MGQDLEASGVLAGHLAGMPPDPTKTMLEIGCGLGMVGIAAARAGHRITMTEINPDALNFARANALANNCPKIAIERLDWNDPQLAGRFDTIVDPKPSTKPRTSMAWRPCSTGT